MYGDRDKDIHAEYNHMHDVYIYSQDTWLR